ncbi:MAG: hypothetical protein LBQ25_07715 [Azonexus sp.]|jgi:hypothetical protein|nr:hypothetical protein [Azonexus sp.]
MIPFSRQKKETKSYKLHTTGSNTQPGSTGLRVIADLARGHQAWNGQLKNQLVRVVSLGNSKKISTIEYRAWNITKYKYTETIFIQNVTVKAALNSRIRGLA